MLQPLGTLTSGPKTAAARGRRAAAVVACLLAALVLLAAGGERAGAAKGGGDKPPNIVVIVTDDQARSTMSPEVMPNLYSRLIPDGTSFSDFVVTTPLCCPSRAAFMTGQYGHNNGVLSNFYPDLRQKRQVLASWLGRRGYRTAHVGKFLNNYEEQDKPQTVAPGWDLWFTQLEKRKYYDWKASLNGDVVRYGDNDRDNVTSVTSRYATRWASRLAGQRDPFFLQVDYYAPHGAPGRDDGNCPSAPKPEPEDIGRFASVPLPKPPSFNQDDVSEMPSFIRNKPKLTDDDIAKVTQHYRCSIESLYGVDRGIGEIWDAIGAQGELNRTVFVFTSDNGYFFGEHRIPKGKPYPYEENIRMPLTIRVPPRYRDRAPLVPTSNAPVANIDVAPTLLELAGAEPCLRGDRCRTLDGRSLMPLIDGEGRFPETRGIALERSSCDFRGVRWDEKLYISYSVAGTSGCVPGEAEMYDVDADPFQLHDLLPAASGSANDELRRKLARKMRRLGTCTGIRGRDPRPPPGFHFCE
jgi:arylsulfatase A-like enzyme